MNKVTAILIILILLLIISLLALAIGVSIKKVAPPNQPLQELQKVSGEIVSISQEQKLLVLKTESENALLVSFDPSVQVLDPKGEIRDINYLDKGFNITAEGSKKEDKFLALLIRVNYLPDFIIDYPALNSVVSEILELRGKAKQGVKTLSLKVFSGNNTILERNISLKLLKESKTLDYYDFSNIVYLPFQKLPPKADFTLRIKSNSFSKSIYVSYERENLLTWYRNPSLRISFVYPSLWQESLQFGKIGGVPARYEGLEGFFELSLAGESDIEIDKVIEGFVRANLEDYKNYTITPLEISGRKGKLVFSSSSNKAFLVLKYLVPVEVEGSFYRFLILESNKDQIENIASTISFALAPKTKVSLYFSNNVLDPTQSCQKVFAVSREVEKTPDILKDIIELLIKGPRDDERNSGYFSNLPESSVLKSFELKGATAIIEIETPSQLDSCSLQGALKQLEATLGQFPEVEDIKVSFKTRG